MLFIFRKLRRSFFLPGKVRTYLAYAVGEIVLIVVGILLALQISEWNEGRKNKTKVINLLTSLEKELESNAAAIKGDLEKNQSYSEAAKKWMDGIEQSLTDMEKTYLLFDVSDYRTPEISTAIMDDILSSEGIRIIDQPELLQRLRKLKHYYLGMGKHENYLWEFYLANIGSYISKKGAGVTYFNASSESGRKATDIDENFLNLYDDPIYKSHIGTLEVVRQGVISYQRLGLDNSLEVLSLVKK